MKWMWVKKKRSSNRIGHLEYYSLVFFSYMINSCHYLAIYFSLFRCIFTISLFYYFFIIDNVYNIYSSIQSECVSVKKCGKKTQSNQQCIFFCLNFFFHHRVRIGRNDFWFLFFIVWFIYSWIITIFSTIQTDTQFMNKKFKILFLSFIYFFIYSGTIILILFYFFLTPSISFTLNSQFSITL